MTYINTCNSKKRSQTKFPVSKDNATSKQTFPPKAQRDTYKLCTTGTYSELLKLLGNKATTQQPKKGAGGKSGMHG